MNQLINIHDEILNCRACPIYDYYKRPVSFKGYITSGLMFIGRDPGEKELELGEPFVGAAGKEFNVILNEAGIKREEVVISNTCKCRPYKNQPLSFEQYKFCGDRFLKREIEVIKPKVIVTLGKEAIEYLNEAPISKSIYEIRGKVIFYNNMRIIPTYHPSYLIRIKRINQEKYKVKYNQVLNDFILAKEMLEC